MRGSADTSRSLFHYDGDALVDEYVGASMTRRYAHGGQVDEPLVQYNSAAVGTSVRRYLYADNQGSIIAHSDNVGAVTQQNSYDPYGIPKSTNDGRFGFTAQTWLKELGLNYYKARIYAPKLGRFLQTDPIFYSDDMNMYAYVGNDPINRRDPTGLQDDDFVPEEIPPIDATRPEGPTGAPLSESVQDAGKDLGTASLADRSESLNQIETELYEKKGEILSALDDIASGKTPNGPSAEDPNVSQSSSLESQMASVDRSIETVGDMIADVNRKIDNASVGQTIESGVGIVNVKISPSTVGGEGLRATIGVVQPPR